MSPDPTHAPNGDELRVRAYLRALHVHPIGHTQYLPKRTPMTIPEEEPPWWSAGKPPADHREPEPAPPPQPSVHVTITPPPAPPPIDTRTHDRRARARRWFLAHGAGAGVGYTFGLYHSTAAFLNTLGPGAPAAGLALAGFGWFGAEMVTERYVRILPSRTRPAATWALRIPFSTALLATALHAPNALI